MIKNNFVALDISDDFRYPDAPYNPPEISEEFKSTEIINEIDKENKVYEKVRNVLKILGFDKENINTPNWNPFSEFINIRDKIIIKPNLVFDKHPLGKEGTLCTITHASVIRPIIDYILLATGGNCKITICDVPLQTANWNRLITESGLKFLVDYYHLKEINIQLLDLRREISYTEDEIIVKRDFKDRDPLGYVYVDLGNKSELMPIIKNYKKFEITDYGKGTVPVHHNPNKNEYCIPKTILNADVFINVPKIKTHRKAGLTCAMKNLIGINGDKRWIAHHRSGSIKSGGDEYLEFRFKTWFKWYFWAFLKRYKILLPFTKIVKKTYQYFILKGNTLSEISMKESDEIMEGSWFGNDTIWRCILDINKILFYANKEGEMTPKVQRRYFCLVDGIVSCEKECPMHGIPKKTGTIMAGFNSVAIDKICADLMGFDYKKIPQIREGFKNEYFELAPFKPGEIVIFSNIDYKNLNLKFEPTIGWKGYIER